MLFACGGGTVAPDPNTTTDSNAAAEAADSSDDPGRDSQSSATPTTNPDIGEADAEDSSSSTPTDDSTSSLETNATEDTSTGEDESEDTSEEVEEENPADPASECLAAGSPNCSEEALCCDGTMCITDGVSTVCAALCSVPTDCVSLCCLPVSDVAAACVPSDYCAAPPPPPPPPALQSAPYDLYEVSQLTRVDQDLYSGLIGAVEVYVVTRYCYQYVYYQDALLSWAGEYSSDSFIIGRGTSSWECEVADVLVP
jgi:hypothetical protein